MSVLAMFMFKSPSLLSFQEKMQKDYNRNNLNTVFHVKNIPSDNQGVCAVKIYACKFGRPDPEQLKITERQIP